MSDGCFWCGETYEQTRAQGMFPSVHGELAKAGIEVHACPRHANMLSGALGQAIEKACLQARALAAPQPTKVWAVVWTGGEGEVESLHGTEELANRAKGDKSLCDVEEMEVHW